MARASNEDFLQNFRFHVTANLGDDPNGVDPLQEFDKGDSESIAGFQTCSIPSWTVNATEYRDGINLFTKKQPGIPTADDVTLTRGVVKRDISFMNWMFRYFRGNAFRCDLTIYVWDQTGQPAEISGKNPNGGFEPARSRALRLFEAFPTMVKPGGDKDGNSDEISLAELTIAFERFQFDEIPVAPAQRSFAGSTTGSA